ncbi:MAG: flagellar assembly protein FliW [Planctomycetes bacterium]|nr:flagellar assembly protein FliW [Planctomycetota bacterium]
MQILTTRFGPVTVEQQDRVEFPAGLVGLPQLKRFVLIRDPQAPGITWLQSTRDTAWAFALVSPRSILPDFQVRASVEQLRPIEVQDSQDIDVYAILNRTVRQVTANLQAPVLINRRRSLGVQLVLSDSLYEMRHVVNWVAELRMSA